MDREREWFAVGVVLIALVLLPASVFGYQTLRTRAAGVRVIDVVARAPEQGGFIPDHLRLRAGETVRLRLSSSDVVHGSRYLPWEWTSRKSTRGRWSR